MGFEYMPKLAIACDADFNLIHVANADDNAKYVCPCCGDAVKKASGRSFIHLNKECNENEQLEFYCENWLLASDKVASLSFKPIITTPYGNYMPDVEIITIDNKVIYVELFFHMRKLDSNYYCKWEYLGNDVIEVDYYTKDFKYIYQNGALFDKEYAKRDFYYNNVRKWCLQEFWQAVIDGGINAIAQAMIPLSHAKRMVCYDILSQMPTMKGIRKNIKTIFNSAAIVEAMQANQRGNVELCIDEVSSQLYRCYMWDKDLLVQSGHSIYYQSPSSLIDKESFLKFFKERATQLDADAEAIANIRIKMMDFLQNLHQIEDLGYKTCLHGDYISVFEVDENNRCNKILTDYKHNYSCENVLNELKLVDLTKKLCTYYKDSNILVGDRKIVITIKGIIHTIYFDADSDFGKVTKMVEKTMEKCQKECVEPLENMVQKIRECTNHAWNASNWNNKLSVWLRFAPDNLRTIALDSGVEKMQVDVVAAMNDILDTVEDYGWGIEIC